MEIHLSRYFVLGVVILYITGFYLALRSIFESRTPQGSMAWILSLICLPIFAIPIYLLCGKKKIDNYDFIELDLVEIRSHVEKLIGHFRKNKSIDQRQKLLIENKSEFITSNSIKLLIDGEETFSEMVKTIKQAKNFILLQMYIFRTDHIGKVIIAALIERAKSGVKVYILYERFGIKMSKDLLDEMKRSGINLGEFSPIRFNKLQYNFRNHRKQLIVDGEFGFFGGINIGDDYLGKYPHIGYWRDSNIKIQGPVLGLAQVEFIKDWKFSQSEAIDININVSSTLGDSNVLLFSSSPVEDRPLNLLQHIELINIAKKRLWIANPYVIPPQGILDALYISGIKGLDVRLIIPQNNDNELVALAMDVHMEHLFHAGVRIYKYTPGMMHQKVILIDDELAIIGSSNLDFRSMFINFENSIITDDQKFILDLEFSLRKDLDTSEEIGLNYFNTLSKFRRIQSHLINTLAPIL
jgi:cardiolipin synthase